MAVLAPQLFHLGPASSLSLDHHLAQTARLIAARPFGLCCWPQGAEGTAYAGCTFRLSLRFTSEYPFKPPTVRFETPCFHPNVDTFGNICLDILKDKWSGEPGDGAQVQGRAGVGGPIAVARGRVGRGGETPF